MTDSGSTYMYWRWMDDPDNPRTAVLTRDTINTVETLVAHALLDPLAEEAGDREAPVRRALTEGPFSSKELEKAWSSELASLVLPEGLAKEIDARTAEGTEVLLRILPSPALARVPWEILPLPSGQRLLERTTIRLDAPAVVNSNRGKNPEPWETARERATLYLLEPPHSASMSIDDYVIQATGATALKNNSVNVPAHKAIDRNTLGQLLRGEAHPTARVFGLNMNEKPGRLLYYGHADSQPNEPGSAAIHLTDSPAMFGSAQDDGLHRAFTALDLLLGTSDVHYRPEESIYPHPGQAFGHEIWPMPPRVALIACESGADHRALETFGMIMAMLNAGAEIVTTTRWTLATDYALERVRGLKATVTTDLVIVVDRAHTTDDPVEAIRAWQLERLHAWTSEGRIEDTPLIWSSLTTHVAPEQAPLTEEELAAVASVSSSV